MRLGVCHRVTSYPDQEWFVVAILWCGTNKAIKWWKVCITHRVFEKGVWKAFYANGQLRSQYESGSPDKVEYWYATGQPKIQEKHRYGLTNVWLSDKISIEPDLQIRTKNEDNRMRISQMYDKQDRLVLEIVRDRFQRTKIVSRKEFKFP